jgi:DNA repair protein RadC
VLELSRRQGLETLQREPPLQHPKAVKSYRRQHLRHYEREVFLCLFLDNQHQLIVCEEVCSGTIDSATIHPREIVKRCLHHNAAAVIFSHNHPSGIAEPSQADQHITCLLREALALVGVKVLDHLVVGDSDVVSFAERGIL